MPSSCDSREPPLVALIPAAGRATRLGRPPWSKEILPVGFDRASGEWRPACATLLDSLALAGVKRGYVLLRQGKWDIPALLGRGWKIGQEPTRHGLCLAYLALEPTASVPETLDRALPFVEECRVAVGFPDILFEPHDAFRTIIEQHRARRADAVLGLFPTSRPEKTDMVELDGHGRVARIVIKDPASRLDYTWSIAVWGPRMSRYLHGCVAAQRQVRTTELHVGDVLQAAVDDGLRIEGVRFASGSYLDVGTPEDLEQAMRRSSP